MLKRLYLDNFKCFVNFQLEPAAYQSIFGLNGSGKTALFDLLRVLQEVVVWGCPVHLAFPSASLTRWEHRNEQTFELDVEIGDAAYQYVLVLEHDRGGLRCRIAREELRGHDDLLFQAHNGDAQLYRDDATTGPAVSLDWTRSGLSLLASRSDNQRLTRFKDWLERLLVVDLVPSHMSSQSDHEQSLLQRGAINFASWFRHISQERMEAVMDLTESLREVIDGFGNLSLGKAGESALRILRVEMDVGYEHSSAPTRYRFDFDELSDGQRALIVLYTVLHSLRQSGSTLCLDEPDNFLALSEIEPFLHELAEGVGLGSGQVLLISHHPQVINYPESHEAVQFFRQANGPVRTRPFAVSREGGLTAAEIVARGWDEESADETSDL